MLSIFKEQQEIPLEREAAMDRSRKILESYLNKGVIPSWDQYFQELPVVHQAEDLEAIKNLYLNLTNWDFLIHILQNSATEYLFHSPESSQCLKLSGEREIFAIPLNETDWQLWLEIISLRYRQNWNVENPFCSFYGELFGKSYRFSLIHGSTSPNGCSKLMLRSISQSTIPLPCFGEHSEILSNLVRTRKSILIAGSTGSGKTSLVSSLLTQVEPTEHIVILEDTVEIQSQLPHQTRFLSGNTGQTSLKAYLSYSLRLSPDRIILGEMRSHEVVPFLMAMNTGHKGLMATIHASSASDALHRVALLFSLYAAETNLAFEKIMELLCRNLEYVVFMENKKVKEVIKILGSDRGSAFFETVIGEKKALF
jgi:type IV secretory pathway ATPase VirB11/archaellum biosynthesis ATPase